jgi:hypothetical protein
MQYLTLYAETKWKHPLFHRSFVLNGLNDFWFRRTEGDLKGLGIALKKIELKKDKYVYNGSFKTYKDCTKNWYN